MAEHAKNKREMLEKEKIDCFSQTILLRSAVHVDGRKTDETKNNLFLVSSRSNFLSTSSQFLSILVGVSEFLIAIFWGLVGHVDQFI